jgi:two-component system response regulator HydG
VPPDLAGVIVGVSPAMSALRDYLPKVARSAATVLITGATGTGKERVAQALHALGPRAAGPFVAVNCAALPEALVEAELFGHTRGAFTGAVAPARGHVAEASGGTLFLDEVGEMTLPAQAKMLRVLEARAVTPIGSSHPVPVDVRVVAATNQALEGLVGGGRFRADLYYRLSVARLHLPPLKERREDIPPLVEHTLRELNRRDNRAVRAPEGELLECLLAHDWPGNVRELRNVLEAVFIDPPAGRLGFDDLPPVFREMFSRYRTGSSAERERLLAALQESRWNKAEAAKQLRCSRMTLYRKLAKYQITRSH